MNLPIEDLEPLERTWLEEARDEIDSLRKRRSTCPSIRLILAARAEALPQELQAAVDVHLARCVSCQELKADLESLALPADITQKEKERILSRVRSEGSIGRSSRASHGRMFIWRALFATAAFIIAFVAIRQLRDMATRPDSPADPVLVQQASPPPQAPEAPPLEKPEVKLTLALLTWRSAEGSGQQLLSDIAPALNHYRADNFADAAGDFETLAAKYPDSVEVHFYLGISRLFLGEYPAAAHALDKAAQVADASFSEDISWYLGLACHRSGRLSEARVLFSGLCSGKSLHAGRACEALELLNRTSISP